MATVEITPIAHRAKWAQQRTEHDAVDAPAPQPQQPKPVEHRVSIIVEGTQQAIDRVLDFAERHVNVRGVY